MTRDEFENLGIGGQVTFISHLVQDLKVHVIVLIKMIGADLMEQIITQAEWLMNLEVKTNGSAG